MLIGLTLSFILAMCMLHLDMHWLFPYFLVIFPISISNLFSIHLLDLLLFHQVEKIIINRTAKKIPHLISMCNLYNFESENSRILRFFIDFYSNLSNDGLRNFCNSKMIVTQDANGVRYNMSLPAIRERYKDLKKELKALDK